MKTGCTDWDRHASGSIPTLVKGGSPRWSGPRRVFFFFFLLCSIRPYLCGDRRHRSFARAVKGWHSSCHSSGCVGSNEKVTICAHTSPGFSAQMTNNFFTTQKKERAYRRHSTTQHGSSDVTTWGTRIHNKSILLLPICSWRVPCQCISPSSPRLHTFLFRARLRTKQNPPRRPQLLPRNQVIHLYISVRFVLAPPRGHRGTKGNSTPCVQRTRARSPPRVMYLPVVLHPREESDTLPPLCFAQTIALLIPPRRRSPLPYPNTPCIIPSFPVIALHATRTG